jgi:hypothetical protein
MSIDVLADADPKKELGQILQAQITCVNVGDPDLTPPLGQIVGG